MSSFWEALARGAGQGATFGWGDEGAARLLQALPGPQDPEGYDREYAAGSAVRDFENKLRKDNATAAREHKGAYVAGTAIGGAPASMAVPAGLGAEAALAARIGAGAAGGAGFGALSGAGTAEEGARLKGAATGAATGAALGAGGAALGAGAAKALPMVRRLMTRAPTTKPVAPIRNPEQLKLDLTPEPAPQHWMDNPNLQHVKESPVPNRGENDEAVFRHYETPQGEKKALWKPASGSGGYKHLQITPESMPYREQAAHELSRVINPEAPVVPKTIARDNGSLQEFVEGPSTYDIDSLVAADPEKFARSPSQQETFLLDLLSRNVDRHGGNVLWSAAETAQPVAHAIDNGLAFAGGKSSSATMRVPFDDPKYWQALQQTPTAARNRLQNISARQVSEALEKFPQIPSNQRRDVLGRLRDLQYKPEQISQMDENQLTQWLAKSPEERGLSGPDLAEIDRLIKGKPYRPPAPAEPPAPLSTRADDVSPNQMYLPVPPRLATIPARPSGEWQIPTIPKAGRTISETEAARLMEEAASKDENVAAANKILGERAMKSKAGQKLDPDLERYKQAADEIEKRLIREKGTVPPPRARNRNIERQLQ